MLILICDNCGALIHRDWECCHECGLEVQDINDLLFGRSAKAESKSAGSRESRERDTRKGGAYDDGLARGFTCILCFEFFKELKPASVLEGDARITGFEQPGNDLAHFLNRQDFNDHVDSTHGGKKAYWKAVNNAKRMAAVRRINTNLMNKESVHTSRREGDTDESTTNGE